MKKAENFIYDKFRDLSQLVSFKMEMSKKERSDKGYQFEN